MVSNRICVLLTVLCLSIAVGCNGIQRNWRGETPRQEMECVQRERGNANADNTRKMDEDRLKEIRALYRSSMGLPFAVWNAHCLIERLTLARKVAHRG